MENHLKLLRKERGLLQKDVAEHLNIAISTYSYWENGKFEPDQESLSKLADFFGVSADYLLGREEKNLPIDRPYSELAENFIREYSELFSDEGFQNYARLYKVMTVRQRIFVLGMIVGWLKEQGVDLKNV